MIDGRIGLAAVLLVATMLVPAVSAQEDAAAVDSPVDLQGAVKWPFKRFASREVVWPPGSRGHDLALERLIRKKVVLDRRLVLDDAGRLADVLITLPRLKLSRRTSAPVVLRIGGIAFENRVVPLMPDQVLQVVNTDTIEHEMIVRPRKGPSRTFVLAPGADHDLTAAQPVTLTSIRFPFMRCDVIPTEGCPALVTTVGGDFSFRGLPPGPLEVALWHPFLGRAAATVELNTSEKNRLEVGAALFQDSRSASTPFSAEGGPVLRVEGLTVRAADIDPLVAYLRTRHADFVLPVSVMRRYAVRQVIIPLASSVAHHGKRVADVVGRLRLAKKAIEAGRPFDEVARSLVGGNVLDEVLVAERERSQLDPALGRYVFGSPPGRVIGPILTARGAHVVRVESGKVEGGVERRSFRHLFIRYDEKRRPEEADRFNRDLASRARVEILDPIYADAVPQKNRK